MAGRPRFSEKDKASVFMALQINDGNVKRTARETGIAESTVRRWRDEWAISPPSFEAVEEEVSDFVEVAERVRMRAITALEDKVDDASAKDLTVMVGVLTDKLDRARGVATSRVEHVHALPPADEIRAALTGMVQGMLEAAQAREEIIDVEVREILELPPAQS